MVDVLETKYICNTCNKQVQYTKLPIQCDLCHQWFHGICEKLTKNEWLKLGRSTDIWSCQPCTKSCFPSYNLDEEQLYEYLNDVTSELIELYQKCSEFENNVQAYTQFDELSKYITHESLIEMSKEINESLSIIHSNCRSLKRNFDAIDRLLHKCETEFKVIALSETWTSDVDNC